MDEKKLISNNKLANALFIFLSIWWGVSIVLFSFTLFKCEWFAVFLMDFLTGILENFTMDIPTFFNYLTLFWGTFFSCSAITTFITFLVLRLEFTKIVNKDTVPAVTTEIKENIEKVVTKAKEKVAEVAAVASTKATEIITEKTEEVKTQIINSTSKKMEDFLENFKKNKNKK